MTQRKHGATKMLETKRKADTKVISKQDKRALASFITKPLMTNVVSMLVQIGIVMPLLYAYFTAEPLVKHNAHQVLHNVKKGSHTIQYVRSTFYPGIAHAEYGDDDSIKSLTDLLLANGFTLATNADGSQTIRAPAWNVAEEKTVEYTSQYWDEVKDRSKHTFRIKIDGRHIYDWTLRPTGYQKYPIINLAARWYVEDIDNEKSTEYLQSKGDYPELQDFDYVSLDSVNGKLVPVRTTIGGYLGRYCSGEDRFFRILQTGEFVTTFLEKSYLSQDTLLIEVFDPGEAEPKLFIKKKVDDQTKVYRVEFRAKKDRFGNYDPDDNIELIEDTLGPMMVDYTYEDSGKKVKGRWLRYLPDTFIRVGFQLDVLKRHKDSKRGNGIWLSGVFQPGSGNALDQVLVCPMMRLSKDKKRSNPLILNLRSNRRTIVDIVTQKIYQNGRETKADGHFIEFEVAKRRGEKLSNRGYMFYVQNPKTIPHYPRFTEAKILVCFDFADSKKNTVPLFKGVYSTLFKQDEAFFDQITKIRTGLGDISARICLTPDKRSILRFDYGLPIHKFGSIYAEFTEKNGFYKWSYPMGITQKEQSSKKLRCVMFEYEKDVFCIGWADLRMKEDDQSISNGQGEIFDVTAFSITDKGKKWPFLLYPSQLGLSRKKPR